MITLVRHNIFTWIALTITLITTGKGCNEFGINQDSRPYNSRYSDNSKSHSSQNDRRDKASNGKNTYRKDKKKYEMPAKIKGKPEKIIYRDSYVLSFNTTTLCPNYVAWYLTGERLKGGVKRTNEFLPDPDIEQQYRVDPNDYFSSGYDRGHMCPAADNRYSIDAMNESFYMSNMCPQNHSLNSGDWNDLEMLCRNWAKDYEAGVYIACGPIFKTDTPRTIGRGKKRISVPDAFFKVVFMNGKKPKAIGFIYPNNAGNYDVRHYAKSVDDVERITGIDFFTNVPKSTQDKMESVCNPAEWGI